MHKWPPIFVPCSNRPTRTCLSRSNFRLPDRPHVESLDSGGFERIRPDRQDLSDGDHAVPWVFGDADEHRLIAVRDRHIPVDCVAAQPMAIAGTLGSPPAPRCRRLLAMDLPFTKL
jgi:hypothetical protein